MKSLNNKTLLIILAGLVVVFVLARIIRAPRLESNLPQSLVSADTSKIDRLVITPKSGNGESYTFSRTTGGWSVQRAADAPAGFTANVAAVQSALGYLVKMVPERVITRKSEKYAQFGVGDSTTRVQAFVGDDEVAELNIGRTDFSMPSGDMQNPFGGGGMMRAKTFVRTGDDEHVYAVEGFLESAFNKTFDEWRDKTLLRLKSGDVMRVRFDYPDSAFVLEKKDNTWVVDGAPADSAAVGNYLSALEFKTATGFADNFTGSTPALSISFEGEQGALAVLKAWVRENDFVVASSAQPKILMTISNRDGLVKRKGDFLLSP